MRIVDRLLAALDRDIGHRSGLLDRYAARQRGQRRAGAQHDVHAARIQRMVLLPELRRNPRGRPVDRQQRGFAQPWPGQAIRACHCRVPRSAGSSVAEFSGASCVPAGSAVEIGHRQRQRERGRRRRIDDRRAAMKRQPVACAMAAGSSHSGVSLSTSVSSTAAVARSKRQRGGQSFADADAAVPAAPSHRARRGTSPAPRRQDRRNRAVRCLALMRACSAWQRTARALPPPSPPSRRAAPAAPLPAVRSRRPACATGDAGSCSSASASCGQFRRPFVASGDIGVADQAAGSAHGAARRRHLAEVEWRAAAAGATTHHHQPGLRSAQHAVFRQHRRDASDSCIGAGARQHRHPAAAGGVRLIRRQCIGHAANPAVVQMSRQLTRDSAIVKQ